MTRVLVHCPGSRGHHASYVRFLLAGCEITPCLIPQALLVPVRFGVEHPELVGRAERLGISLHFSRLQEGIGDGVRQVGRIRKALWEVAQVAREMGANRTLLLYADPYLQVLPFFPRLNLEVTGILFRPTFHYPSLFGSAFTRGEWATAARKAALLALACRSSLVGKLFWLDPYAVDFVRRYPRWFPGHHEWLADPLEPFAETTEAVKRLRRRWDVPNESVVWLFFGAPTERKGASKLLEALARVRSDQARRVIVLMVGACDDGLRSQREASLRSAQAAFAGAVRVIDEYVSDEDAAACFQLADVVLVPYQRHVGSSGVLLRAAQAKKPVVCSDFGLLGEWTRRHRLGIAIDTTSSSELAWALERALEPSRLPFDEKLAESFSSGFAGRFFAEKLLSATPNTHNRS